ncbi:MAG: response regulator, partial [Pseudomonadota bacterium]
QARDCGANETLVKPISGNGLASRICSMIDNPRPFVSTDDYFGPDRRRKDLPYKCEDRRLLKQENIKVNTDLA